MIRFAPTLEKDIHIGNVRILLCNYLYGKKNNLPFIFRVDYKACVSSSEERSQALKTFDLCSKLGITFDKVIFQRERRDIYDKVFNSLNSAGYISTIGGVSYLKLGLEKANFISYNDEVFGLMKKKRSLIKDVIIYSKEEDNYFYNFTSVVDDVLEGVKIIIRGADHIDNTFVQHLMIKRIKEVFPEHGSGDISFAHIPLCLNSLGNKISKTDDVECFRVEDILFKQKILPSSLIHYLIFGSEKIPNNNTFYNNNFSFSKIGKAMKKICFSEIKLVNKKILNRFEVSCLESQLRNVGLFYSENFIKIFSPFVKSIEQLINIREELDKSINEEEFSSFEKLISSLKMDGFEKEFLSYKGEKYSAFISSLYGKL